MSQTDPSSPQVFISYSSHDRGWAEAACARLEARGVGCWIAPRNITPGTEWGAAIIEGIDRCRVMVLIFSSQANASAQVRREVERALSKGLAILPVRVEDARPHGAMEYALGNTHWLDAFTPPTEDRMTHMADSVESLLGRRPAAAPPSPTPPPMPVPPPMPPRMPVAMPGEDEEAEDDDDDTEVADPPPGWPRWIWAAAGGVALLAVAAFVVLPGLGRASSGGKGREATRDGVGARAEPAPGDFVDETEKFVGRWVVVGEFRVARGPVSKEDLAKEQSWWGIRGDHAMRWHTNTPDGGVDRDGTVHFRAAGDVRYFEFEENDDGGRHMAFYGIYRVKDDLLEVCYRGVMRPRPTEFPTRDDRSSNAVSLIRARGGGPGGRRGPR